LRLYDRRNNFIPADLNMAIIEARQLTKRFKVAVKSPGVVGAVKHLFRPRYTEHISVDAIDFAIQAGESVAYIGPNGAGKSTTVKLLTGILAPSSGTVRVRGCDPHRQRTANARQIGVVFGQRSQLWWDLPVHESLRLLGDIYEVPQAVFAQNLDELIELLDLVPLLTIPARQLSLGQRMRCDLAAALLHAPPILYLDEPTIGLDVAVKERIRQFIKHKHRDQGTTILLTSHDLQDIVDVCERVIMIDRGRIVFDGSLPTLKNHFGHEYVLHLVLQESLPTALALAREAIPELMPDSFQQPGPERMAIHFDASDLSQTQLMTRLLPILPVRDVHVEEPNIERIIRQLYEGKLVFEEPA
jgi:ABC-2 type transport system ATP-binding protein